QRLPRPSKRRGWPGQATPHQTLHIASNQAKLLASGPLIGQTKGLNDSVQLPKYASLKRNSRSRGRRCGSAIMIQPAQWPRILKTLYWPARRARWNRATWLHDVVSITEEKSFSSGGIVSRLPSRAAMRCMAHRCGPSKTYGCIVILRGLVDSAAITA